MNCFVLLFDCASCSLEDSVIVLSHAVSFVNQPASVMVEVVGRCIASVCQSFRFVPAMLTLPPDCFLCIAQNAVTAGIARSVIEVH